jgi:hypothetical protein
MQQVELAIRFLQANQGEIQAGNSMMFNNIFGNPGELRDVAVLNPTPISGTANVGLVGTQVGAGLIELDFQDDTQPYLPGQVNVGDFVFVGDAIQGDTDGFVGEVLELNFDADGSNQSLIVANTFSATITTQQRPDTPVHRVIKFQQRADPDRYVGILETFKAIRSALSGIDPDLAADLRGLGRTIRYNRGFTDMSNFWGEGIAEFSPLDSVVSLELSRGVNASTRGADRLVRQAGLSNSDSHFNIDRLDDLALGQPADYQGRRNFPLLWTEDNEIPLQFEKTLPIVGATDEHRAFFRDRQTIFGEPDNPFVQHLGPSFFEERIWHPGKFFDELPEVVSMSIQQRAALARRPVRSTNAIDLNRDGRVGIAPGDLELRRVSESGTPTFEETELRKWQMIIKSFAEHSTDLDQLNVAVIGISERFDSQIPPELAARDAGNYARFAALINLSDSLNQIDVTRIEPFGKRATAGFNPIVPRN